MNIDTDMIIPISEANQNFTKVARLVDERGAALIMKNNAPRYLVIDFGEARGDEGIASFLENKLNRAK
ncbi:MAG: type II toxin-antitoxin system Phd/YefM family antitoxin [Butyrivibrio sp.]|nr:type II toxin-antitoxin system Phd/YefM family antitoxin [Butyrivibrio sp.]